MPRRKQAVATVADSQPAPPEVLVANEPQPNEPESNSKPIVPETLQFPLLVTLRLCLSYFLLTGASTFTAGDLASVSRKVDDGWEVAGLIGWKIAELAVGWWGGYDYQDIASLTILSHAPHLYLLTSFYHIRPSTAFVCLAVDILSTSVPFRLLRDPAATHRNVIPKSVVANRSLINDRSIRAYTSLLAAAIYGVVVFGSLGSWLPVHLVLHFDGLRDISAAHNAALPKLIALSLPVGYAAREFIFTSATGSQPDSYDTQLASFDPETATLRETFVYNVWGYSKRTRTLIKRTFTLAAMTGIHNWLQTFVAIEGTGSSGAAGWSAVWALAAIITGAVFWWVGDVEGISN